MTTYYAIEHRYGANMADDHGDHLGSVYMFATRRARDAWVDDGNPYVNNAGARAALVYDNPRDRRTIAALRTGRMFAEAAA